MTSFYTQPSKEFPSSSSVKYPEFVAYHFLNARGELMAMEEDGQNTERFLNEGFNIDGSSISGMASVEKSDLQVVPEEESFQIIKIDDFEHPRFLAHLVDDQGKPHPCDPRGILNKLVVEKAHSMGFEPYMFSEIEFYILDEDGEPADHAGYCSLPPRDKCSDFREGLGKLCKDLGMKVKRVHHENGPGQNEIELNLTPCLKNADDTVLCMWIMDMLAAKKNQKVVFSPKPFPNEAGNGLHHHILLRDLATGDNVFMNPELKGCLEDPVADNTKRLSPLCKHAIAGLLKYADDITAVFAASNESFARLTTPGFEAPVYKAWDFSNRTALIRVPKSQNDMTRFEYRGGDLSGSVHLFGSVLLAAMLQGIQDELPCPANADFNMDSLTMEELARHGIRPVPLSLEDCIKVLKTSKFLEESLGPHMVEFLIQRDEELLSATH